MTGIQADELRTALREILEELRQLRATLKEMAAAMSDKCPTCNSPKPHLHPAVQAEGEVHICPDDFHKQNTPENRRHLEREQ